MSGWNNKTRRNYNKVFEKKTRKIKYDKSLYLMQVFFTRKEFFSRKRYFFFSKSGSVCNIQNKVKKN